MAFVKSGRVPQSAQSPKDRGRDKDPDRRKSRLTNLATVLFVGGCLALPMEPRAAVGLLLGAFVAGVEARRLQSVVERWDDETLEQDDQAFGA